MGRHCLIHWFFVVFSLFIATGLCFHSPKIVDCCAARGIAVLHCNICRSGHALHGAARGTESADAVFPDAHQCIAKVIKTGLAAVLISVFSMDLFQPPHSQAAAVAGLTSIDGEARRIFMKGKQNEQKPMIAPMSFSKTRNNYRLRDIVLLTFPIYIYI